MKLFQISRTSDVAFAQHEITNSLLTNDSKDIINTY